MPFFQPLGPRVLVKRLPLPPKTESGLFLLGRDYPTVGKVLAVGNGWKSNQLFCECGHPQEFHNRWDQCLWCTSDKEEHDFYLKRYRQPLDLATGQLVQWAVDSNYDLSSIFPDEPDILLLDYDQINLVIS
jgi:hypothetical protein